MSAEQGTSKELEGEVEIPALNVEYDDALFPQLETDNVQGAIDALKGLKNNGVLFLWTLDKLWPEVYAEIVAANNIGILLVETDPTGASRLITGTGINLDAVLV